MNIKREKSQNSNIRIEKQDITPDPTEIKRILDAMNNFI